MSALIKLLIGAILMIASVWWVLQGSDVLMKRSGLADLITLVNAAIPLGLFIIGIFILWLELDEIRIDREIRTEEKRARKRK